jgi:hypothetical protein
MARTVIVALAFLMVAWPAPNGVADERAEASRADAERLARTLDALRRELPRETFDPEAVVARVGRDPATLFAWVRDRTWWVPYEGALRGPRGVLADRLGSSCDRALLLADLFRAAGHPCRLARATLPEDRARAMLARVRRAPPLAERLPVVDRPTDEAAGLSGRLADASGVSADAFARSTRAAIEAAGRDADAVRRRVERLAAGLASASKESGVGAAKAGAPDEADVLRAIADHWWVETGPRIEDADSATPEVYDPLLPDAKPGECCAVAEESIAYDGGPDRVPLPDERCHRVVVRVLVETWAAGRLETRTALEHALRPAERLGQEVVLEHAPAPRQPPEGAPDAARADRAILAHREWTPFLRVGGDVVFASTVVADGALRDGSVPLELGEAVGGGVADLLGGRGGLGGARRPAADPGAGANRHLVAEWIEYEILSPGRAPTLRRRPVFDWIGPAARAAASRGPVEAPDVSEARRLDRGLALLGRVESVILPCDPSPAVFADRLLAYLVETKDALLEVHGAPATGTGGSPDEARRLARALTTLASGPSPAHRVALGRLAWRRGPGAGAYTDRPNVVDFRWRVRPGGDGTPGFVSEIDVVANDAALPGGATPFALAAQGIADTVIEDAVLGAQGGSAADLLEAAAAASVPLLALTRREDERLAATGVSRDVRARIEEDLAAGHAVFLPARPPGTPPGARTAWWRVDGATGSVVGVLDSGLHGAGTEDPAMRGKGRTLAQISAIELAEAICSYLGPGHPASTYTVILAQRLIAAEAAAGVGPGIETLLVGIGGVILGLSAGYSLGAGSAPPPPAGGAPPGPPPPAGPPSPETPSPPR